jgi:hypothetical protein
MKVISRFKHIVPPKLKIFLDVYIMLSDEGELTFIYSGYFFKSFSLIPPVYTVIHVDKGGNMKEGKITDLPEGDFWSPDFHVKGNMIEFAALQRLKNREGYHTLVTGELDPVQQKLTKVKETKLMDHLIVPGYYKEKFKKEYIPYPGMLTVRYMHKDGSRTLVYENKSDGPIAKKVGETHYISYFAAHVYVMRLNAANELQWMQVIGKDQFESNTDMHVGAASFMDDKENIHLVFYDHNKNTAPEPVKKPEYQDPVSDKIGLASVQITSDGKMTKTFITDKKESKWHFVPKHVYAFRSNEMVFLSINEKGGSLLGNQKGVYTKSGWHLGIIRLQ